MLQTWSLRKNVQVRAPAPCPNSKHASRARTQTNRQVFLGNWSKMEPGATVARQREQQTNSWHRSIWFLSIRRSRSRCDEPDVMTPRAAVEVVFVTVTVTVTVTVPAAAS